MFALSTFTPALAELFVAISSLGLVLQGVYKKTNATRLTTWFALSCFFVSGLILLQQGQTSHLGFEGFYLKDSFTTLMKLLILFGASGALLLSIDYLDRENASHFEYPLLVTLSVLGMMVMVSANDLMSMYIGIELQSLPLYVLTAFKRNVIKSTEAGLKYFILGALSSGMLLYGCSLVYGFTGATNFGDIAQILNDTPPPIPLGLLLGLIFLIIGLSFKVSLVPFHMWTPDVYEGAPTPVTAFLASAPKVAGLALFVRLLTGPFGNLTDNWQQILTILSASSMILGAVGALYQTSIKRLLAYSSIGHMGYAMIGLATGDSMGIKGLIIYVALYVVMGLGSFACVINLRRQRQSLDHIDDLKGLSTQNPLIAFCFAALMFSMAGIPPLAGFFSKYYIFLAAIDAELYTLALIGVLCSVIAAFYYLRLIKLMYFDDTLDAVDTPKEFWPNFMMTGMALIILLFCFYPTPLIELSENVAQQLMTPVNDAEL